MHHDLSLGGEPIIDIYQQAGSLTFILLGREPISDIFSGRESDLDITRGSLS